jgi:hypothetical protein
MTDLHSSGLTTTSAQSHTASSTTPDDQLDTITAIVECKTSHGPLTIDVREHWGPLGATLVRQEHPRFVTRQAHSRSVTLTAS